MSRSMEIRGYLQNKGLEIPPNSTGAIDIIESHFDYDRVMRLEREINTVNRSIDLAPSQELAKRLTELHEAINDEIAHARQGLEEWKRLDSEKQMKKQKENEAMMDFKARLGDLADEIRIKANELHSKRLGDLYHLVGGLTK